VVDRVPEPPDLAHDRGLGGQRHVIDLAGRPLELEHHEGDLHRPHAVGDGVVDLEDQGGPVVLQPLHDGDLPERPGPVEALHRDRLGQIEHRPDAAVATGPHEAQVEVEVEVGIDLPAGRRDRERVRADPLPHAGDEAGAPVDEVAHPNPVR
jgi:hypothetical protein